MINGSDSFSNLWSRNRKNIVWDARLAHPLPTSPLKGEGLKTQCLAVLNVSIWKLSEPLMIRFCSNYRECGNTTTFPSIPATPYLWHSLRSVKLSEFSSILYEMTPAIITAPGLRRVILRPGPLSRLFVTAVALKISCLGGVVIIQPG